MYEVGGKIQSSLQCNIDLECAWSSHGSSIDYAKAAKFQNFITLTKISNSVVNDKGIRVCFHILEALCLLLGGLVYRSTANPMYFQKM